MAPGHQEIVLEQQRDVLEPEDQHPPAVPGCMGDREVDVGVIGDYVEFQEPDYTPYVQAPYCPFVEGLAWMDAEGQWVRKLAFEAAPVFNAKGPHWARVTNKGWGGRSKAAESDAETVLSQAVTLWNAAVAVRSMEAAVSGKGYSEVRHASVVFVAGTVIYHLARRMDTHQPVKIIDRRRLQATAGQASMHLSYSGP